MEYGKIIAVTGLPGLYELISSKSDGAIVRSLDDQSTKFVSSRIHNFSHLESIEVYTTRENVNLVDVFKVMEQSSEKLPDDKDNGALKKYFEKVYPDMDMERVYTSDMKKMVKWFAVLRHNNIELKLSEAPPVEEPAEPVEEKSIGVPVEAVAEDISTEKTTAKTSRKKAGEAEAKGTSAKKEETATKASAKQVDEAPKKKAAPKKKTEEAEAEEAPKKKAAPKKK